MWKAHSFYLFAHFNPGFRSFDDRDGDFFRPSAILGRLEPRLSPSSTESSDPPLFKIFQFCQKNDDFRHLGLIILKKTF